MKFFQQRKFWRRSGLGVLGFTLFAAVACLGLVDYSPYHAEKYYAETIARLPPPGTSLSVTGELHAGFGRALLTPVIAGDQTASNEFGAVPLAGYGARKGRAAIGVHDDAYVKAIALKVQDRLGVVVGADALIIPRAVAERAVAQLQESGLKREQIYFGATHTHSSVGGWGEGIVAESFAGPYDARLSEWFSARLVAAVRAAVADLQPAALGAGEFLAPEFVRNRLVGRHGTIDPEFSFQVMKQTAGGRIGVIGSYAAHATVLSAGNMQFSADYPGYWQRAVEQATGGLAMFLAGGVGSHSPTAGAGGFEGAERMGNRLAELVREQLPLVSLTNVICFGIRGLDVSLPPLHARVTDGLRLRPWLARQLLPVSDQTFIQGFRLNNTVWLSTPCDFSGELALRLKEFAHARGFDCVVTSFNGDYIGYVIPARYYHLSGYEPRLMSFYGPNTPDYLDELIRRIAAGLWN